MGVREGGAASLSTGGKLDWEMSWPPAQRERQGADPARGAGDGWGACRQGAMEIGGGFPD